MYSFLGAIFIFEQKQAIFIIAVTTKVEIFFLLRSKRKWADFQTIGWEIWRGRG